MSASTVLAPLQLSAFALSPHSCDDLDKQNPARNNYKICPIAQPNYTFLRMRDHLLASDVLDPVDLHCASDATLNSRVTDLGTGNLLRNRLGVYVHWTLPQVYRTGTSTAGADTPDGIKDHNDRKIAKGFPASSTTGATTAVVPDFRPVPNRWLVTRRLNRAKMTTDAIPANFPTFQSWVIESDRLWNINDTDMNEKVDLEVDRTPFINPKELDPTGGKIIEAQAEVFIGLKTDFESWKSADAEAAANVNLNILTSTNPLFADYVVQNSNVFSMVDDFSYQDPKTNTKNRLNHAWADYHVIGWHSKPGDDPFFSYVDPKNKNVAAPKHADRLQNCKMQLKDADSPVAVNWLSKSTSGRILCHATMYDVEYNFDKEPNKVLGRIAGQQIIDKQPISIGATPMDALLAYCQSHLATDAKDGVTTGIMHDLEVDLLRLQTLLREREDDDVDGIQAAQDENLEQTFAKTDGGTKYHLNNQNSLAAQPKGTPTKVPTPDTINILQTLNDNQATLDNLNREVASKRWALFAEFWNYVSGFIQKEFLPTYTSDVSKLFDRLDVLLNADKTKGRISFLTDKITKALSTLQVGKGTDERFYQAKDPTLLLANIDRGWDADFIDVLNVRLTEQTLKTSSDANKDQGWQNGSVSYTTMVQTLTAKLPADVKLGATALLMEFYELQPSNHQTTQARPAPQVIPWFHDEDVRTIVKNKIKVTSSETRSRDQWQGTQPWRPLYFEWEALYYHIPFEKYNFKEYNRFSSWGNTVVRYGIDEDLTTPPGKFQDVSRVSGRNFLLPQAASSLAIQVDEVLKATNPDDLVNIFQLPKTDQDTLVDKMSQLQIVTAPMTGLTSHLLTQREGMHVKPLVRLQNQNPVVIQAAADGIKDITDAANSKRDLTKQTKLDPVRLIQMMNTETVLTPYGNSVPLENDKTKPPLKPVTHGQLMFTKLNIVDKFGQAIAVIDPRPPCRGQELPTMYPCISDTFHPSAVGDADPKLPTSKANVVHAQPSNDACPFISLGPSLNQPARLNAQFVIKDSTNQWKRASDWDNPIWGWLVINYADKGLQIFLADGTFYREVRLGGRLNVSAGFKWLPFDPPAKLNTVTQKDIKQLNFLIDKLTESDQVYLKAFFHMITQSLDDKQIHAPATYSTYNSAIIGKPLALTNAGWSLELAGEPGRNWSTNNPNQPLRHLVVPDTNAQYKVDDPAGYTFRVKLGDAERSFDGLVGYFLSADAKSISDPTASDLQLNNFYTYFMSEPQKADPRINLDPSVYPKFTAFYPPPGNGLDPLPNLASYLQVFGLIVDPFQPVHAYSGILPNKSLKLPEWAVEQALSKITAFFSIGPLISPVDVSPLYDSTRALTSDNVAVPMPMAPANAAAPVSATNPAPSEPTVSIPLPPPIATDSGGGAVYRYLQPYWMPAQPGGASVKSGTGDLATEKTRYNPYAIDPDAANGVDAAQVRLIPGPYTALEGFAQVTRQKA